MHQPRKNLWNCKHRFSFFAEISLTYATIIATDDYHNLLFAAFLKVSVTYLKCLPISKMEPFAKIRTGLMPLTTIAKSSIFGTWPGFKYTWYFQKSCQRQVTVFFSRYISLFIEILNYRNFPYYFHYRCHRNICNLILYWIHRKMLLYIQHLL